MTLVDLSIHGKIIFFQFFKEVKGYEKLLEDWSSGKLDKKKI